MNILLLSTFENQGGAAIACKRLAKALIDNGENIHMLTNNKISQDNFVTQIEKNKYIKKTKFISERLGIITRNKLDKKKLFSVSIANFGTNITKLDVFKNADIINIHWINQGFLSLKNIKQIIDSGKPIIWTIHDMWPITGICHHSLGCMKFTTHCGKCPLINSTKEKDLAYKIFNKKLFINQSNIQIVSVSNWLNNLAEKSTITGKLNKLVIGNTVDTNIFKPRDKQNSRKKLNLQSSKTIITIGAAKLNDPIKGFKYLKQALSILEDKKDYLLLLFGEIKNDAIFLQDISIDYKHLGSIKDTNTLTDIYAASDMIIVPSLYETFGQTISEAMSCERPAISFNNSGQTDIIDHKKNGYLAKYKDSKDLATGIKWIKENQSEEMQRAARNKIVNCFSQEVIANKYLDLYKKTLLNQK